MAKFIQFGKMGGKAVMFPRGNVIPVDLGRSYHAALTEGGFHKDVPRRTPPPPPLRGGPHPCAGEDQDTTIQTAIAIIIRFSVSDRKPSGTLLDPPTQAHLRSRRSI